MSISLSLSCPGCEQVFLAANCSPTNPVQCPHCSSQFQFADLAAAEIAPVGDFGNLDGAAEIAAVVEDHKSRQTLSMGLIAVPVVLTLLAGYFVIFAQSTDTPPEATSAKTDSVPEPTKPPEYFDRAFAEVKRIVAQAHWSEMMDDVREPDRIRPLMEWFYNKVPVKPINLRSYDNAVYFEEEGRKFVTMKIVTEGYKRATAVVEETETGFKLDWETTSGVTRLQWEEFNRTTPQEAEVMRVEVMRSSLTDRYYYAAKLNPANAMGVRLWSDNRSESLYAVVPLNSPLAAKLQKSLDSNVAGENWSQSVKMMLKVSFPDDRTPLDRVELTDIVQEGWLVSSN